MILNSRSAGDPPPPSARAVTAFSRAPREAGQKSAEESWENEGGGGAPRLPALLGIDRLADQLRALTAALNKDFASGRIGTRHNTYAHRARLLRQLAARLVRARQSQAIAGAEAR